MIQSNKTKQNKNALFREMVYPLIKTAPPGCIIGRSTHLGSVFSTREIIKEMQFSTKQLSPAACPVSGGDRPQRSLPCFQVLPSEHGLDDKVLAFYSGEGKKEMS